jgi:hypothetical protein
MQAKKPATELNQNGKGQLPALLVMVMMLLAAIKLGLQVWGANKGFDIWDEGLYILMLNFYDQYPTEPHNYYSYVMAIILPLKEYGLLPLRLLAIGIETAGIAFFSYCIHQFFAHRPSAPFRFSLPPFPLMLFVFLGAAFLSVYARAFSYNDFSYFSTLVVSGLLMLFFKDGKPLTRPAQLGGLLLFFIIGGLLGAQLIVKFSTSILLVFWVLIFIALFSKQSKNYIALLALFLFTGFVVFLTSLLGSYQGFSIWLYNLNEGVAQLRQIAYEPYYIIVKGYLYVDLVLNGVYFIAPLVIAFFAFKNLNKRNAGSKTTHHLMAYAAGTLTWLVCSLAIPQGFLGEFHYRFIALHIFTLLYWGIPVFKHLLQQKQWQWLLFLGLLIALPFMSLLGSSNTATQTLTRYLAPWFAAIMLFLGCQLKEDKKAYIGMLLFLITFSGVNYVVVQVYNPYGLNAPLTDQNTTANGLDYLNGISFDKPTATFFEELKDATMKSGYQKGGPILALGDLCGAVTAMGGYIPETFWYFSDENAISPAHSHNFSCKHLSNLRIAEHLRLPLVYINSGINQQVIDCLSNSEVPFPEAYYLESTIFNPYAQESLAVWVPKQWKLPMQ